MIKYSFIILTYLLFTIVLGLKHLDQSHAVTNQTHAVTQSPTIQQMMTKINQLKSLLQDNDVNTLLKINSQLFENTKLSILQTSFTKQQITILTQTKTLITKWQQCTPKQPYFNGSSCVQCSKQQIFDFVTQKCARCKFNYIYDTKKKLCVNRNTKINLALTQMDLKRAQQIIIIRANQIAANLMSFVFDTTQRLNYRLQFQQTAENRTVYTPNATNPHFLNLVLLSTGQKISQFKLKKEDIPCPKQKPFFSINKCINCNYPTHLFDATTKWCVKCSNNFIYSVNSHQCIKLQKNKQT